MEPNGASDLIYDDAPFNQSFSIDVVSSLSLNEATEIMKGLIRVPFLYIDNFG